MVAKVINDHTLKPQQEQKRESVYVKRSAIPRRFSQRLKRGCWRRNSVAKEPATDKYV